jgi:hypothetical protein
MSQPGDQPGQEGRAAAAAAPALGEDGGGHDRHVAAGMERTVTSPLTALAGLPRPKIMLAWA